jgi:hypothetical protein
MERSSELQPVYESYLLRLWPGKTEYPQGCRVMLQNVTTQQQHFFADLTALHAFLARVIDTDPRADGTESGKQE